MSGTKRGTLVPKKGTSVHRRRSERRYAAAIARALRSEFLGTHHAVKTLMRWTGAGDRAAKHWLAGTRGPTGMHLIAIMGHSGPVLEAVMREAGLDQALGRAKLLAIEAQAEAVLRAIRELNS
jgi:hypothetical protein